jgi:hypothetical protein
VKPAGFIWRVNIAAQRAYSGTLIALQRLGKLAADDRIARSCEFDEENRAHERSREEASVGAGEVRHGSRTSRGSEWKEQLA